MNEHIKSLYPWARNYDKGGPIKKQNLLAGMKTPEQVAAETMSVAENTKTQNAIYATEQRLQASRAQKERIQQQLSQQNTEIKPQNENPLHYASTNPLTQQIANLGYTNEQNPQTWYRPGYDYQQQYFSPETRKQAKNDMSNFTSLLFGAAFPEMLPFLAAHGSNELFNANEQSKQDVNEIINIAGFFTGGTHSVRDLFNRGKNIAKNTVEQVKFAKKFKPRQIAKEGDFVFEPFRGQDENLIGSVFYNKRDLQHKSGSKYGQKNILGRSLEKVLRGGIKSDVYVEKSLMDQANLTDVKLNPLKKINRGFKSTFGKDANPKDYYRISTEQLLTSKMPINTTGQSVYDDISNQIVSQLKTKAPKQTVPVFYNPKTSKSPGAILRWGLYGLPTAVALETAFNTTSSYIGQWQDYKDMRDRLQDTNYADFQALYYDLPQQDRDNISLIVSNYINNPYELENKQQFDTLVNAFEQQYGEKGLQMLNAYVKYQTPDYSNPAQIHLIDATKSFVNDHVYQFETNKDEDNAYAEGGPKKDKFYNTQLTPENESIYSQPGAEGGRWDGEEFHPSQYNNIMRAMGKYVRWGANSFAKGGYKRYSQQANVLKDEYGIDMTMSKKAFRQNRKGAWAGLEQSMGVAQQLATQPPYKMTPDERVENYLEGNNILVDAGNYVYYYRKAKQKEAYNKYAEEVSKILHPTIQSFAHRVAERPGYRKLAGWMTALPIMGFMLPGALGSTIGGGAEAAARILPRAGRTFVKGVQTALEPWKPLFTKLGADAATAQLGSDLMWAGVGIKAAADLEKRWDSLSKNEKAVDAALTGLSTIPIFYVAKNAKYYTPILKNIDNAFKYASNKTFNPILNFSASDITNIQKAWNDPYNSLMQRIFPNRVKNLALKQMKTLRDIRKAQDLELNKILDEHSSFNYLDPFDIYNRSYIEKTYTESLPGIDDVLLEYVDKTGKIHNYSVHKKQGLLKKDTTLRTEFIEDDNGNVYTIPQAFDLIIDPITFVGAEPIRHYQKEYFDPTLLPLANITEDVTLKGTSYYLPETQSNFGISPVSQAINKDFSDINSEIGSTGVIGGSYVPYSNGIIGVPHDLELYTTAKRLPELEKKIGFKQNRTSKHVISGTTKYANNSPTHEAQIAIIDGNDTASWGEHAEAFYAVMHPKEYNKLLDDANFTKTGERQTLTQGVIIPMSPEALLDEVKSSKDVVEMKVMFDNMISGKGKHRQRAYQFPIVNPKLTKEIVSMANKKLFGVDFPLKTLYPNLDLTDVESNKQLLKKLEYDESLAENENVMEAIMSVYDMESTWGTSGIHDVLNKKDYIKMANSTTSMTSVAGSGANAARSNIGGGEQYANQGFMTIKKYILSYNPDKIHNVTDYLQQLNRLDATCQAPISNILTEKQIGTLESHFHRFGIKFDKNINIEQLYAKLNRLQDEINGLGYEQADNILRDLYERLDIPFHFDKNHYRVLNQLGENPDILSGGYIGGHSIPKAIGQKNSNFSNFKQENIQMYDVIGLDDSNATRTLSASSRQLTEEELQQIRKKAVKKTLSENDVEYVKKILKLSKDAQKIINHPSYAKYPDDLQRINDIIYNASKKAVRRILFLSKSLALGLSSAFVTFVILKSMALDKKHNEEMKRELEQRYKKLKIDPQNVNSISTNDSIYTSLNLNNFIEKQYAYDGPIHIKKENKGKFTEAANRAGKSVQEYASQILANKDHYSTTLVKRANFARVFGKKK